MSGGLRRSMAAAARRAAWRLTGTPVVHLLHIGKTGGTALHHAIRNAPPSRSFGVMVESHGTRLADVPRGEKVVFFLRDPIDRFVSGFYSRQRQGKPRYVSPWSAAEAELFGRYHTPDAVGRALGSSSPGDRAAAERAMAALTLVQSYWSWFGDETAFRARLGDVLFIGRQERLAADFETLKGLLGLPREARLPADDVEAHRNPAGLDRRLSSPAENAVRDWYRRDYAFIQLCEEAGNLAPLD